MLVDQNVVLVGDDAGWDNSGNADLGSDNCLAMLHACSSSSAKASPTSRLRSNTGDDECAYAEDGRR
jgi:hypothetical protein